jgi:hypothetical protein
MHGPLRRALPFALTLGLAACGAGAKDPAAARIHDLEAAARVANRLLAVSTAFVTSGLIEIASTDETIALAVYQHVKAETGGCGMITVAAVTVSVDFGMGCTLATGQLLIGGAFEATISHKDNAVNVGLTFNGNVDGQELAGRFAISTTNGNTFDYAGDMALDGTAVSYAQLSGGISLGGAQASGKGTLLEPEGDLAVSLDAVHQRFVACYGDEGEVTLTLPDNNSSAGLTFASTSSQNGKATYSEGTSSRSATLPLRTNCPR